MTRNSLYVLAVATLLAGVLHADDEHAPLPEKLVAATTAYIANESGDLKAYDNFYKELRKWNRFRIVTSRESADIVMILNTVSTSQAVSGTAVTNGGVTSAFGAATPIPALQLRIETGTGEVLWSDQTDKWMSAGHAPSKLVSNLRKRLSER